MQELRFVAVSEDGRYAVLAIPGRSARFTLPIDERLRAVALGQTSRLAQYEIEVESPLRPKEIQARIRAGETVEEIADAAGITVERVRWFEGPVLAERAYIAEQAQSAAVRRPGDAIPSSPAPRLGEIVAERLSAFGAESDDAQWDAKKLGDGSWQVQLTFISAGRLHVAEWIFDPRRRHVLPADDNAARMSLPGAEPPVPAAPPPGEATVTHLAPRLSAASGHGGPVHASPGHGAALGNGATRASGQTSGSGAADGPGGPGVPGRPVTQPRAPEPAETEAPATASRPAASTPPPSPADVAARGSAPQPGQASRPGGTAQPGGGSRQPPASPRDRDARIAQAHPESPAAASAAKQGAPAARSAPASDEATRAAPAEAVAEQAGRPGRKAPRSRRSSVPSWDEIMFGNSRQRD